MSTCITAASVLQTRSLSKGAFCNPSLSGRCQLGMSWAASMILSLWYRNSAVASAVFSWQFLNLTFCRNFHPMVRRQRAQFILRVPLWWGCEHKTFCVLERLVASCRYCCGDGSKVKGIFGIGFVPWNWSHDPVRHIQWRVTVTRKYFHLGVIVSLQCTHFCLFVRRMIDGYFDFRDLLFWSKSSQTEGGLLTSAIWWRPQRCPVCQSEENTLLVALTITKGLINEDPR